MTRALRIATPPGVGDTYWILTKLQAFRQKHGVDHVTLCVKRDRLQRALEWPQLVDFVDAAEEYAFSPDEAALRTGYSTTVHSRMPWGSPVQPPHCCMWVNGVLESGKHIREWMPGLELDLSFRIKTAAEPAGRRVVVYASSDSVNAHWLAELGPEYWTSLIDELGERTGQVPTLIGKAWDDSFRYRITAQYEDLLGQTSLAEVAGILERASVVVGVISGMTILANHFRTPTVALYPDPHRGWHPNFPRTWVAPDAPYVPIPSSAMPAPTEIAAIAAGMRRPT